VREAMHEMDADWSGEVSFGEFEHWWRGHSAAWHQQMREDGMVEAGARIHAVVGAGARAVSPRLTIIAPLVTLAIAAPLEFRTGSCLRGAALSLAKNMRGGGGIMGGCAAVGMTRCERGKERTRACSVRCATEARMTWAHALWLYNLRASHSLITIGTLEWLRFTYVLRCRHGD
jgi:hypothetical protein